MRSAYVTGKARGVEQDETEAVKWFIPAAEKGFALQQYNLALCYANGWGVAKDQAEAVKWFRKAAEPKCVIRSQHQYVAAAQYNLALCYSNGWGVNQDYAEAVKWFRRASEQACFESRRAVSAFGK